MHWAPWAAHWLHAELLHQACAAHSNTALCFQCCHASGHDCLVIHNGTGSTKLTDQNSRIRLPSIFLYISRLLVGWLIEHWCMPVKIWLVPLEHWFVLINHWFVPVEHWFAPNEYWCMPIEHCFVPIDHWIVPIEHSCACSCCNSCTLAVPETECIAGLGSMQRQQAWAAGVHLRPVAAAPQPGS